MLRKNGYVFGSYKPLPDFNILIAQEDHAHT
jgi:hypothetical protein